MEQPYLKTGAKETGKDKILKFIKLPTKPIMNRISKREVIIKTVTGKGKKQKDNSRYGY